VLGDIILKKKSLKNQKTFEKSKNPKKIGKSRKNREIALFLPGYFLF
jgi:hypothetical protein